MPRHAKIGHADTAVVVQAICTTWTKASRGGAGAVARSRAPEAMTVPNLPDADGSAFFVQFAEFHEAEEFRNVAPEAITTFRASGPLRFGRVLVQLSREKVRVVYELKRPEWTPSTQDVRALYVPGQLGTGLTPCHLEPPQLLVPEHQTAFYITSGEWGRVSYNWRYSHGYWLYQHWTFNIAMVGAEGINSAVFLERPASHVLTRLSRLF